MSIPPAFLDELRARTDLPSLLGRSVKLQRAGRDWRGCCPFHNEKTPSFYVYADHYHCFGCGAHGDAIRWLTEKQGLPFPEAVKELASAAGLEVPQPTPQARAKAERAATLHEVVAAAAAWFAAQLWAPSGAPARAYLTRRSITPETARAFGLGFAPEDRTGLRRTLASHDERLLVEAGLLIAPENSEQSFDRFRGRLIFPIRDARGRPVGFGGRALGDIKPKYLNSPDTPLFDKGRLLFNLDHAAGSARERGRLFLVEGYMDAIALAQAGVTEVVAPLGTALTEHQLALAWRLVPEPTLCFDGDAAGQAAAAKAARRALPLVGPGRSLRIVPLPAGLDPDDLIRSQGLSAFEAIADRAERLHRFVWEAERRAADAASPEGRAALSKALQDLAATIEDAAVRREYANAFREAFWAEFGWRPKGRADAPLPGASTRPLTRAFAGDAHGALVGVLNHPDIGADHIDQLATLPVADRRLLALRNALVASLGEQPNLDRPTLDNTLADAGLSGLVRWTRDTCGPGYPFTWDGAAPESVRPILVKMLEALSALDQNFVSRVAAKRQYAAAESVGDEDGANTYLSMACELMSERALIKRALIQYRDELPEAPAHRIATTKRVQNDDGEGKHGDDGTAGNDGDQGHRRAAARSQ